MNKFSAIAVWLFSITTTTAQVGIGTLTPNTKSVLELNSSSKGFLLPRLTSGERVSLGMTLTPSDAGMMVYQTIAPKGVYTWEGTTWLYNAPVDVGTTAGNTLRWDGTKWIPVSNLYNGGGSIGINMGGLSPNYQLHLHSTGPANTRLQITSAATTASQTRGLVIGIGNTSNPGVAHILLQEDKALWFGTNGLERVRIDSVGRVGINKANPSTTLDVNGTLNVSGAVDLNGAVNANGTVKIGSAGSVLQSIIRFDYEMDPPSIAGFGEYLCNIECLNTTTNAVVYASPGSAMDHIMIGYSRVNPAGTIQIKLMNMSTLPIDLGSVMFHIAVIQ